MAARGAGSIQDKVNRLLSKEKGKPVLKPRKELCLRNDVMFRDGSRGEATCVAEMSAMMACWKQNNFVEELCSRELNTFYSCIAKAKAAQKLQLQESAKRTRLNSKQATNLLKRFPIIRAEI